MRILALADNDDFKWAGPNQPVDLVVSCGDVYDSLIVTAAQGCSAPHVLAVKGNHDSAGRFPPPIIDVHLRVVTLPNGFRVAGFNGCCRYKPRGHFLYDQDEATRLLQQLGAADILIAHNSPQGVHEIDDDVHQGFRGLSEYLRTHSPRLLVHGHQHISRETLVESTRVVAVYGHAFIETQAGHRRATLHPSPVFWFPMPGVFFRNSDQRPEEQFHSRGMQHRVFPNLAATVPTVRIAASWLDDLESLIPVMAHYVGLDRLLRAGLARGDEPDLGWRADLACVFLGLGLFGANSAVQQRSATDGHWTWWRIRSRGPLPARVFGYALAPFAVSRGERRPLWARWLTHDAHDALDTFQRGVRYLERGDDYLFEQHGFSSTHLAPPPALRWSRAAG